MANSSELMLLIAGLLGRAVGLSLGAALLAASVLTLR